MVSIKLDHEKSSLAEAFGLCDEDLVIMTGIVRNARKVVNETGQISRGVEYLAEHLSCQDMMYIAAVEAFDLRETQSASQTLSDKLKELISKLG